MNSITESEAYVNDLFLSETSVTKMSYDFRSKHEMLSDIFGFNIENLSKCLSDGNDYRMISHKSKVSTRGILCYKLGTNPNQDYPWKKAMFRYSPRIHAINGNSSVSS